MITKILVMLERLLRLPLVKQTNLHEAVRSYSNPRLQDGSYLSQEHRRELQRDAEIIHMEEYRKPEKVLGGTLRHLSITTHQGYDHDVLVGIPDLPESETPVIGTSAWFTSADGHNEHIVRNLTRAGNFTFFVGAEGSYRSDIRVRDKTAIALANSAATLLSSSLELADRLRHEGHPISSSQRNVFGESRGAMVGMGVAALDHDFDQHIVYADLVAPCIPERLDSLRDAAQFVEQISREPVELARLIGKLGLIRGLHYSKTVDLGLQSLRHQVAIGGAIFSGEAGAMARQIDFDKSMHVLTFESDFASMSTVWNDIFADHKDVTVTPLPGRHLTIADMQTLRYIIARNKAAQQLERKKLPIINNNIVPLSHILVSAQRPTTKLKNAA